ncbi:lasso RiPP family leader peptide-containing protein [Billgrantia sp. Q4P2]|uniref:lasso RiPP family leader peptide-containing protein n=1 Tax=Billgrantia sp. Q4P2 TaxID=3463857 RepID=UPI0040579F1D
MAGEFASQRRNGSEVQVMDNTQERKSGVRREYRKPLLTRWGTVADLTLVGLTRPGSDVFPGNAPHSNGSRNPPGHNR